MTHFKTQYSSPKPSGEVMGVQYVESEATFETGDKMKVLMAKYELELYVFLQKMEQKYKIESSDLKTLSNLIYERTNERELENKID